MANNIGSYELAGLPKKDQKAHDKARKKERTKRERQRLAATERDESIAERNKAAVQRDMAIANREAAQTALIETVTTRIAQGGDIDKDTIEALTAALQGRK